MLYKLGRYLRCLGFDTLLEPEATTAELVRRADAEGRVFLTRNAHLEHQSLRPRAGLLLRANDPVAQLHEVVERFDLDPTAGLFTRCLRCNLPLDELPGDSPRLAAVPERVRRRHSAFYACPGCRTVFWRGSHVVNTLRKLGLAGGSSDPAGA